MNNQELAIFCSMMFIESLKESLSWMIHAGYRKPMVLIPLKFLLLEVLMMLEVEKAKILKIEHTT